MTRIHQRVGLSGAGIAITFSVLGHAGIALVALHHAATATRSSPPEPAVVETLVSEFEVDQDNPAAEPEARTTAEMPVESTPPRAPAVHAALAALPRSGPDRAPEPERAAVSLVNDGGGPRFALVVAPTIGRLASADPSTVPVSAAGDGVASAALRGAAIPVQSADVPAKLRIGAAPAYTNAALSAGVEGNVPLEIVVSESGNVTSAFALERVGYGLDEAARQSVLGYRFTPALRNGKPIAVRMQWLMRFQLR